MSKGDQPHRPGDENEGRGSLEAGVEAPQPAAVPLPRRRRLGQIV